MPSTVEGEHNRYLEDKRFIFWAFTIILGLNNMGFQSLTPSSEQLDHHLWHFHTGGPCPALACNDQSTFHRDRELFPHLIHTLSFVECLHLTPIHKKSQGGRKDRVEKRKLIVTKSMVIPTCDIAIQGLHSSPPLSQRK